MPSASSRLPCSIESTPARTATVALGLQGLLVMALTAGGPGFATDMPATYMYSMAFTRGQINLGAASATVMLATVAAIVVPYLYSELRSTRR